MNRFYMNFFLLVVLFFSTQTWAEVIVIVNESNPLDSITKFELGKIYKGKQTLWKSGEKIEPYELNLESAASSEFHNNLIDWSMGQRNNFWVTYMFKGLGTPPKVLTSDAQAISLVSTRTSAIAYINKNSLRNAVGVKQLIITK